MVQLLLYKISGSAGKLACCNEQSFRCTLSNQRTQKFLYLWPAYVGTLFPFLSLNINSIETKSVSFHNTINSLIARFLRNGIAVLFGLPISYSNQKVNDKLLKIILIHLQYFCQKVIRKL